MIMSKSVTLKKNTQFFLISGHGLTVQHLRYNSECDVYEELEPIDKNLKYDFNFQQINHLRREVIIKPVRLQSILSCSQGNDNCFSLHISGRYSSSELLLWNRRCSQRHSGKHKIKSLNCAHLQIQQGGLGTRDEMCLSFPVYYPRIDLPQTGSRLLNQEYFTFLHSLP